MCYKVIVIAILGTAMALWIFISANKTGINSNSKINTLEYTDLDIGNISETVLIGIKNKVPGNHKSLINTKLKLKYQIKTLPG